MGLMDLTLPVFRQAVSAESSFQALILFPAKATRANQHRIKTITDFVCF